MEVPIESCVSAKIYKFSYTKRVFWVSAIVLAYAISIPYAYYSAGEPREAAIVRAQQIEDEKWSKELLKASSSETTTSATPSDIKSNQTATDIPTYVEKTKSNNELESESSDMSDEEFEALLLSEEGQLPTKGWFSSWYLTEGQKKIKKKIKERTEKLHKKLKAAAGGDDLVLPPSYLPSAWACLALFATLTVHALFHLLCLWLVDFKAYVLLSPVKGKVAVEDLVLIKPPANRGKAAFVLIQKAAVTGDLKVEFQRQSYTYTASDRLGTKARDFPKYITIFFVFVFNLKQYIYLYQNTYIYK